MKDRKGFTLIELLAVLVVLSVILSISVPKIMDVRYESSKKAFTNDVDELQGIAQLEYNNKKEARLYNFEDGNQTNVVNEEDKLNFKGDNPGDGYIKIYSNGDIHMNVDGHIVSIDGRVINLTFKEYEMLKLFLSNQGIVYTRDQLLSEIWGVDYFGETRTVDMHIKTLRQKLGESGKCIKTVRNVGYRMETFIE